MGINVGTMFGDSLVRMRRRALRGAGGVWEGGSEGEAILLNIPQFTQDRSII